VDYALRALDDKLIHIMAQGKSLGCGFLLKSRKDLGREPQVN
jgi:hypothetical protein